MGDAQCEDALHDMATSVPPESPPLSVRVRPGRGRCLLADDAIPAHACVLRCGSVGHCLSDRHGRFWCHQCLRFGEETQLRECEGCHAVSFCSADCAAAHGSSECAAFVALARCKGAKHEELLLARWLVSTLIASSVSPSPTWANISCADCGCERLLGYAPGDWQCLLELVRDHKAITGYHKRVKLRRSAVDLFLKATHCEASIEDLAHVLAAIPLNEFGLFGAEGDLCGRANFPVAALVNHSCVPNVAMRVEGRQLCMYALRNIDAGEEITHCYVSLDEDALPEKILQTWGFACQCDRCEGVMDLTEFDERHRCECGAIVLDKSCDCCCNLINQLASSAESAAQ